MSTTNIDTAIDNTLLVNLFYEQWKRYTGDYILMTNRQVSEDIRNHPRTVAFVNRDSLIIQWDSPKIVRIKGVHCKNNTLSLTLLEPSTVKNQIVFEVQLETELPTKLYSKKSNMTRHTFKLDNNTLKSTILTRLLIALANITKQNKLENVVSLPVVAILDAIESNGVFKDIKPLYPLGQENYSEH